MNKQNFLSELVNIDNFYAPKGLGSDVKLLMEKYGYKTYKEYYMNKLPSFVTHVNITKIKQVTSHYEIEKNPFLYLYEMDKKQIFSLYELLTKTHNGLTKYEQNSEPKKEIVRNNIKGNITNKLNDLIEMIRDTDQYVKEYTQKCIDGVDMKKISKPDGIITINYLHALKASLENKHYTKRQLFQNFLYELYNLLKNYNFNGTRISKNKIFKTVNSFIINYFDEDINFTIKTDLTKFKTTTYRYHGEIELTHGIK